MTVDVVWACYRHPDIISRGYWDQGLLERILDRTVWRPADALDFVHHDGFGDLPAETTGAVVVIPAQHHTKHARVINRDIARLDWVLVILTGDECSIFPWRKLKHPNMRLWIMTPRRTLHERSGARFIGEGWHPDTPDVLKSVDKTLDWFFAGQITHDRRRACAEALRDVPNGELIETPGFTKGLDRHDYLGRLARAKVAPAPAGPGTPDSFRLYEALETGAVPLADARCPDRDDDRFWDLVYGTVPFPIVTDWDDAPKLIDEIVTDWPATANRCGAWWTQQKRSIANDLDDDIRHLAGHGQPDGITVIMPTSVIPTHPSTDIIAETIDSIRSQLGDVEIIVAADGLRPEQQDRSADYHEYRRRLLAHRWPNILPLYADEHIHQGNLTRLALEQVRTPLVLFVEHDTPLCGDIPWQQLGDVITSGRANVIRLHHEALVLEPHRHLMLDAQPVDVDGVPLLRTVQWSQRPHLASTSFYRHLIDTYFGQHSRTMIEDVLHGVVDHAWREHQLDGWDRFRLWMYAPSGDMKRSLHLDGRGADPKYEDRFVYAYDGPTPEGAPRPTAERVD